MASITIDHLTKTFGQTTALDDLSLQIEDREFVVLLGPTGAGKTTTLRCVAGLERPDDGRILFGGEDVTHASPAGRDVAFVFQDYALYPRKTVYENISFPLIPRGYTEREITEKVQQAALLLRIDALLGRYPSQLSGGEQQRVALGRAMVRAPRAFLMDEPLTNLDFQLRAQMRSELKRIQRELNTTFFYVTNDQVEALSMGDRIAVLNKGVLQQVGTAEEIYSQPVNLFVAQFIGRMPMNFLPCRYHAETGMLVGEESTWRLDLNDGLKARAQKATDSGSLVLGIRPEDISLSRSDGKADVDGEVYVVEPFGDCNVVDVSVGAMVIKIKTPVSESYEVGTRLTAGFDLSRAHLFDGESGLALGRS